MDSEKEKRPDKDKKRRSPSGHWVTPTDGLTFASGLISPVTSPTTVYTVSAGPEPILVDSAGHTVLTDLGNWNVTSYRSERQQELEQEIAELKRRSEEQQRAFLEERKKKGATEESLRRKLEELEGTNSDLSARLALSFVLNRIHDRAKPTFLTSKEFQDRFLSKQECSAFIMAVDLRRSTDLMLKSRTPEGFAQFITTLCGKLRSIILDEHGVFDKFTGDGILCFFPDFYSGEEAGYHAIAAADKCHRAFELHYREHRASFHSVLMDVGLGIGIDYGATHLVPVGAELTIVGEPVVYACRMGGAPAGVTLLNQPAYEQLLNNFSEYCAFEETTIDIKHEGSYLAYAVRRNERPHDDSEPAWLQYLQPAPTGPETTISSGAAPS